LDCDSGRGWYNVSYWCRARGRRWLELRMTDWNERIVINPEVLVGKPVIKGTRLAVDFIVELLAQGWSEADILKNYLGLVREDILACLAYASEVVRTEKVYLLPAR